MVGYSNNINKPKDVGDWRNRRVNQLDERFNDYDNRPHHIFSKQQERKQQSTLNLNSQVCRKHFKAE